MKEEGDIMKPVGSVLVITHYFTTGPPQELAEYLRKRIALVALVEHPFSYSNKNRSTCVEYNGGCPRERHGLRIKGPQMLLFIKDILMTIFFAVKMRKRFDLAVGADCLNAFSCILLRSINIVKNVIYMTVDYTPKRFESSLANTLYHALDRFCCNATDYVWNSSTAMKEQRERNGLNIAKCAPQITVPDGVHFSRIRRRPLNEINRADMVFLGHLIESNGVDLALDAFSEVHKTHPEARFVIIGTGPLAEHLAYKARSLGLNQSVIFTGFIESHEEVERLLTKCAIGLAPKVPKSDSPAFYSDISKPKVYTAAGLPVIITTVPKIAGEIAERRAGLVIPYTVKDLTESILRLLDDEQLYAELRENAIRFSSSFEWDHIFDKAFRDTGFTLREVY